VQTNIFAACEASLQDENTKSWNRMQQLTMMDILYWPWESRALLLAKRAAFDLNRLLTSIY